jgi:uncharacterized RDD family membrane protein YckC
VSPRPEESPYPKADVTLRLLARLCDLGLAVGIGGAANALGPILAAAYLLAADGLIHGQSIGKRIFGVRAMVRPPTPGSRGQPAGYRESFLRNAPIALVALFLGIPQMWIVFFLVGVPILGYEAFRVWKDERGIRMGDLFADTQVVDGKVVSKIEVVATHDLRVVAPTPPAPGATATESLPRA